MTLPPLDMRDSDPIVFLSQDDEIPLPEAVQSCHAIRDQLDAALALCECEAQDAPTKCGACDG